MPSIVSKLKITFIFLSTFASIFAFAAEPIEKAKTEIDRPNDLRVRATYSFVNQNLESKTFKNSNTSEMGSGYDFMYRRIKSDGSFRFLSSTSMIEYKAAVGISPSKIQTEFNRYMFDYQCHKGFGLGLEFRERKSDVTLPNQAFARSTKTSLRASYGSSKKLDEFFSFDYEAGIIIPLIQYEKSPRTGAPGYTFAPDAEISLVYKVNHFIDASIGVQLLYESSSYSGDGDRGTKTANETFIHTHFPIDLRFRF